MSALRGNFGHLSCNSNTCVHEFNGYRSVAREQHLIAQYYTQLNTDFLMENIPELQESVSLLDRALRRLVRSILMTTAAEILAGRNRL